MALIGRIRKNFWLVLILLGLALAAFVIMDAVNANNRGGLGAKQIVGSIAGQEVDLRDFQTTQSALYSRAQDRHAAEGAVWNYYVEKAIVDKYAEESGIGVSGDELVELQFGPNLSPIVQNNFRNQQTGQVNMEQLLNIKQQIEEGNELDPGFVSFWKEQQKMVVKTAKQNKMNALISKSIFTPSYMVETKAGEESQKASFDYVKIPFDHIADSEVSVSDADILSYMKNNASQYTNEQETRTLKYATMDVLPTSADSVALKDELGLIATEFRRSQEDSIFVLNNEGFVSPVYANKKDFNDNLKNAVTTMNVGDVYGPYIDQGSYVLAKLMDKKSVPDSVEVSHILRTVPAGDAAGLASAKSYIDSLKSLVQSGEDFGALASTNSQDPGSAIKNGELGYLTQGRTFPEFNDACFFGSRKGGLYTVTTQAGVHLIKVTDIIYTDRDDKFKLAYINSPIVPSQATQDNILAEMNNIVAENRTLEALQAAVSANPKLQLLSAAPVNINDYRVGTLQAGDATRDMVKWAFNANTTAGAVSPSVYTFTDNALYYNNKYALVALEKVIPAGLQPVDVARTNVEFKVRNMKKADAIKSKITGSDLNSIASAFATSVGNAMDVTPSTSAVAGMGSEPLVVSSAFGLETGAVSKPIVGNSGVFVVKTSSKTPASQLLSLPARRQTFNTSDRNKVNFGFLDALKKKFKPEDNRATYF